MKKKKSKKKSASPAIQADQEQLHRIQTVDPRLWAVEDVSLWLTFIGLEEHQQAFLDNSVSGEELFELDSTDLKALGVIKLGHRKKLERKIKLLSSSSGYAWTIHSHDGSTSESVSTSSSKHSSSHSHARSSSSKTSSKKGGKKKKKSKELTIKCKFKGEWRVLTMPSKTGWKKVRRAVRREFKGAVVIRWKDTDGDFITIRSGKHYKMAREKNGNTLRFFLKQKKKKTKTISNQDFSMLKGIPDAVCVIDKRGMIQYGNEKLEELFGYKTEELIGQNVKILMTASTAESHDFYLWRYSRDGSRGSVVGQGRKVIGQTHDGQTFPVFLSVTDGGENFTGIFTDLRSKKAKPASGKHDFSLLENLLQTVIVANVQGKVLFINKIGQELTGYSPMEILGRNVNMIMPEPYHSEHDGYLRHYVEGGDPKIIGSGRDVILKNKDGKISPIHLNVTEQGEGDERLFTGVLTPVDQDNNQDEKKVLEEQKASEQSFLDKQLQVLGMLLVAACVIDSKGTIRLWNESCSKLLGYSAGEVIGKNVNTIMPSPDKENHSRYIRRYIKTRKSRVLGVGRDVIALDKEGNMIPVKLSVSEQYHNKGSFFIGTMQAIT